MFNKFTWIKTKISFPTDLQGTSLVKFNVVTAKIASYLNRFKILIKCHKTTNFVAIAGIKGYNPYITVSSLNFSYPHHFLVIIHIQHLFSHKYWKQRWGNERVFFFLNNVVSSFCINVW